MTTPIFYSTPAGIPYEELTGYPQFTGTRETLSVHTRWKIAWSRIWAFFREAFPQPTQGQSTTFQKPLNYPGYAFLYLQDATISPLGGEDAIAALNLAPPQHNSYGHALLDLRFGTVAWEQEADTTLRTTDITFGVDFANLSTREAYWTNPNKANRVTDETLNLGVLIPTVEYSVRLHHYPFLPLNSIIDLLGKVNDTEGDVIGHEAVETLLYVGAIAARSTTWKGTGTWEITHRFSERKPKLSGNVHPAGATPGWNHFWRPAPPEPAKARWEKIVGSDSKTTYEKAKLSTLFTAET